MAGGYGEGMLSSVRSGQRASQSGRAVSHAPRREGGPRRLHTSWASGVARGPGLGCPSGPVVASHGVFNGQFPGEHAIRRIFSCACLPPARCLLCWGVHDGLWPIF